jgi:hypothetical protein
MKRTGICLLFGVFLIIALPCIVFSQGALAPSGPPAPTMKTLHQVQPRIPIDGLPVSISQPGSYYLTGNLSLSTGGDGIVIDADDVIIDLNGFALNGAGAAGCGILVTNNHSNIAIRNGVIREWGGSGIQAVNAYNSMFSDLQCYNNTADGLAAGTFCEIRNVMASANGGMGLFAAQACRMLDCTAHDNGIGIYCAGTANEIIRCTAQKSGTMGIFSVTDGIIRDCIVRNNGTDGIQVVGNCCLEDNQCINQTNGAGVFVSGNGSRVSCNILRDNQTGLKVSASGCHIEDNQVSGNSTNYAIWMYNHINLLLSELPETIDAPAKVKLAGSLELTAVAANGITIASGNVTIDMDGHALMGTPGTLDGINLAGAYRNITIRNGTVQGWGQSGIDATAGENIRIENVTAYTNGHYGIWAGDNSVIRNCIARDNSADGIASGYNNTVTDCASENNGGGGILASQGSVVQNCTARGNANMGIYTASGIIRGSSAWQNAGDGISISSGSVVADSTSVQNEGNGISAASGGNVIHDCSVSGNLGEGVVSDYGTMIHHCVIDQNSSNGVVMANRGSIRASSVSANSQNGIKAGTDVLIADTEIRNNNGDGVYMNTSCMVKDSVISGQYMVNQCGIHAANDYNGMYGNRLYANYIGLKATGSYGYIVRNYAQSNVTNYNVSATAANDFAGVNVSPGYSFSSDQPWMNVE